MADVFDRLTKARIGAILRSVHGDRTKAEFMDIAQQALPRRFLMPLLDAPPSLKDHTAVKCKGQKIPVKGCFSDVFFHLGVLEARDGRQFANAPLSNMLVRLTLLPALVSECRKALDKGTAMEAFTDPPVLKDGNGRALDELDAIAARTLGRGPSSLAYRSRMMNLLANIVGGLAPVEAPYCGFTSTDAYINFGIFHLANEKASITATTPGLILPPEFDPLKWPDPKKPDANVIRRMYFMMLEHAASIGERRYFADRDNTARILQSYPEDYITESVRIAADFTQAGVQIRIGKSNEVTRHATLVSDSGVVYSVREEAGRKITHNYTVFSQKDASRAMPEFNGQWQNGQAVTAEWIKETWGQRGNPAR